MTKSQALQVLQTTHDFIAPAAQMRNPGQLVMSANNGKVLLNVGSCSILDLGIVMVVVIWLPTVSHSRLNCAENSYLLLISGLSRFVWLNFQIKLPCTDCILNSFPCYQLPSPETQPCREITIASTKLHTPFKIFAGW